MEGGDSNTDPEPKRYCSKCNQHRPVTSFDLLRNGSRRKTCSKHTKRSTASDKWVDVERQLRRHGSACVGQGQQNLNLDVCVDFEDCPIAISLTSNHQQFAATAVGMSKVIWDLCGFRFHNTGRHEGKSGSHFYYYCAQDAAHGSTSASDGKRTPTPSIAMHECHSRLLLAFKPELRIVNIRLDHEAHAAYCDRALKPEIVEYIEAHLQSTPRQIYQDILADNYLRPLAKDVTQKQVWYWWNERSASAWRLKDNAFESIAEALEGSMLESGDGSAENLSAIIRA
ncbi:hypothetical protein V8E36_002418 [Tilletia maclaganii]